MPVMSLAIRWLSAASAPAPSKRTSPMCETSNSPTPRARPCGSWMTPLGILHRQKDSPRRARCARPVPRAGHTAAFCVPSASPFQSIKNQRRANTARLCSRPERFSRRIASSVPQAAFQSLVRCRSFCLRVVCAFPFGAAKAVSPGTIARKLCSFAPDLILQEGTLLSRAKSPLFRKPSRASNPPLISRHCPLIFVVYYICVGRTERGKRT